MNILSLIAILAILFALAYHAPCHQKDEMTTNRQEPMQSHLQNHQVREGAMKKWPSFNNTAYIFILGLFRKEWTPILTTPQEHAMFMSAIILSQKKNMTLNEKQFAYRLEDTGGRDVIETLDRTCLSISENEILGIVGPRGSYEARTIASFCKRAGLPVLGYSITDPELSDHNAYPTFYRMSRSDIITAQALLKLFEKYRWNSTNVIYQGDSYGQGGLRALNEVFGTKVKISRSIKYDIFTDQIEKFRDQLDQSPSRIVLLWASPNVTKRVIQLAVKEGDILAPLFLWILTTTRSRMRMKLDDKQLVGMLFIRSATPQTFDGPINRTLLHEAIDIWKTYDNESYPGDEDQIDTYALYAFDSAWLLISAFIELCRQTPSDCPSLVNTSHCFASRLTNREKLHKMMQTMSFLGVSGHVQFSENSTDRPMQDGSYFIIENLQSSKTNIDELHIEKVLKFNGISTNTVHRDVTQWIKTNASIQWPSGSNEAPVDYTTLEGKTLNITVYISPPFYMEEFDNYTKKNERKGYVIDLITLLQQRMKFNINITVAPNGTHYNDLVNGVENGTYSIVMADLAKTASRLDQVDFSVSIYDNTLRLIVRKSRDIKTPMMAFLKPFHYSLWLGFFLIIHLFSAFLIAVFEFVSGKERAAIAGVDNSIINSPSFCDIYHGSKLRTFLRSMYHTVGSLVQRGSELQARSPFARFQTVIVWLMSVVLVALFTSNMVQYFTSEREKSWIQGIEDLRMCGKVECNRIGVVESSQHADYIKTEVMNNQEMNYHHLTHPMECYTKLLDYYIDVGIADSSTADYFTQTDYCDLEVTGLPFGRTNFGVAMPKQWPYKDVLDKNIMDLRAGTDFDNLLTKWFQKKNCDRKNEAENNGFDGGLTFLQTRGLFIVFGVFTSINLMLFILHQSGMFNEARKCFSCSVQPLSNQQSLRNDAELSNQSFPQPRVEVVPSLPIGVRKECRDQEETSTQNVKTQVPSIRTCNTK